MMGKYSQLSNQMSHLYLKKMGLWQKVLNKAVTLESLWCRAIMTGQVRGSKRFVGITVSQFDVQDNGHHIRTVCITTGTYDKTTQKKCTTVYGYTSKILHF